MYNGISTGEGVPDPMQSNGPGSVSDNMQKVSVISGFAAIGLAACSPLCPPLAVAAVWTYLASGTTWLASGAVAKFETYVVGNPQIYGGSPLRSAEPRRPQPREPEESSSAGPDVPH